MDYYEALRKQATPVDITPTDTSYFSESSAGLDPRLFVGTHLISSVRNAVLGTLLNYLKLEYYNPEMWAAAWLAGSGVSHQWHAQREPADLDCLVGINYLQFRQANPQYTGLSDREIADLINEGLRKDLNSKDELFQEAFELTFYVNIKSNIEDIKPYAAYSLTSDTWTVPPSQLEAPKNPEWALRTDRDLADTQTLIKRYSETIDKIQNAPNDAIRRNVESVLANLVAQGSAMFEDIHSKRSEAFGPSGEGYGDFNNYRWQAGKQSGAVNALKRLHDVHKQSKKVFSEEMYGMELADASILIRRAATRPRPY